MVYRAICFFIIYYMYYNIATALNGRKNINRMGEAVSIVCIISAAVQMLVAGPATIIISFLLSLFGLYCVHRGRASGSYRFTHLFSRPRRIKRSPTGFTRRVAGVMKNILIMISRGFFFIIF